MNDVLIKKISIPYTSSIRRTLVAINNGAIGVALLHDETNSFYGLITDGDIRRALLNGNGLNTSVDEIYRPKTVTATIHTPSSQLLELITKKIRCIPILDNDNKVIDLFMLDKRSKIPVSAPQIGTKELQYVSECLLTGWVSSSGKFVQQFEAMFADFCGAKYAVATSNGTTALHLALLSLNICKGDEVIVPSLTFIATANAVTYTGAKPVFVDSEPQTWNIDPDVIEKAITPKTKAIIPVHLYGHPANMDTIHLIASKYNLAVIEDAAQSHGALYKKQRVGLINQTDVGCFSFFGNKIVTTGEGGMAITNRKELFEKMRILRDHGMSEKQKYLHSVLGYNYRMTNLQAAIGVAQMEKIKDIIHKKNIISKMYTDCLKDIPGIKLPHSEIWAKRVCWLYSILVDENSFGIGRDELMEVLNNNHIENRPLFIPVHKQPIYNNNIVLPVAENLSSKGLSLPSSINLRQDDIKHVVDVIKNEYRQ